MTNIKEAAMRARQEYLKAGGKLLTAEQIKAGHSGMDRWSPLRKFYRALLSRLTHTA
jgi:hypothetical protein